MSLNAVMLYSSVDSAPLIESPPAPGRAAVGGAAVGAVDAAAGAGAGAEGPGAGAGEGEGEAPAVGGSADTSMSASMLCSDGVGVGCGRGPRPKKSAETGTNGAVPLRRTSISSYACADCGGGGG